MSLIFMDGFDHYTNILDKWDSVTPVGSLVSPTQVDGRFTPGALEVAGNPLGGSSATKNIPPTSDIYIGFAYSDYDSRGEDNNQSINGPAQAIITLNTSTGVAKVVYNGNTVASASGVMTSPIWQYIEVHIFQHATLGIIEIRRNGVSIASQTNLDTLGGDFVSFQPSTSSQLQRYRLDDLYILNGEGTVNNGFVGDTRITVLRPTANGLDNNFTPFGSATNFGAVNEDIHDADSTYVEAGQQGATEEYENATFAGLGISPGTIHGVQVVNAAKKTDAGQLQYKDLMIIGGIEFDNGVEVIASAGAFKMTTFIRDTDPSDDGTWTESKVAAVGSGLTITFREV